MGAVICLTTCQMLQYINNSQRSFTGNSAVSNGFKTAVLSFDYHTL